MNTPKEMADWYKELADNGNGFMVRPDDYSQYNVDWRNPNLEYSPQLSSDLSMFKINPPKPKLKKIDMSVCIGSSILCEYSRTSDFDSSIINKLDDIRHDGVFKSSTDNLYNYCRVLENHWHARNGRYCPLPDGLDIEVKLFCESGGGWKATVTCSHLLNSWTNVFAFKVLGVSDGWAY